MSESLWWAFDESTELVETLGWSLIHFLWQGAAVAMLLAAALYAMRGRSPNVRYLTACVAFAAMAVCPVGTFAWLWTTSRSTGVEDAAAVAPALVDLLRETDAVAARMENPTDSDGSRSVGVSPERPSPSATTASFDIGTSLRPLTPWVVALWLVGVMGLSARLCFGWLCVERMRRRSVRPVPPEWEERLTRIAERMRVSRPIRLLESALVEAPVVIGALRPIVLVPASAWLGLSPTQLEALLAHELAHVRRYDYALNFVQSVLETLLFYHPAVWWVSRTIRLEREACCDEMALEISGDRRGYAHALVSMEELRGRGRRLAVAASGGLLIDRIRRIVGVPAPQSNRSGWWLLAAVAGASVLLAIAMGGAHGVRAGGLGDSASASDGDGASASDGDEKRIADDERWGPESGGLRCRVTPVPADTDDETPDVTKGIETFRRGDDVTLAVELKNVSEESVTLLGVGGNVPFLGPQLFELELTAKKDGKPISRPEILTNMLILIEASAHEIEPGKTLTVVLRPAGFHAPLAYRAPPGEYEVRVRYHVDPKIVAGIAQHWPDKEQGKAWTGEATSNAARFTVAEDGSGGEAAELRWGEAKDGVRAAVSFRQSGERLPSDGREAVPLNTKLDVVLHIQNVGEKPISLVSETWRQEDRVTVKDEAGEEQMLRGNWYTGLPILGHWTLRAKEAAEIPAISVGIAADQEAAGKFEHPIGPTLIAKPGAYRFGYAIHLDGIRTLDAEGHVVESDDTRQVELTTGETTVTVRARTPEDDAAERVGYFTGHVEFVGKDGEAIKAGQFWARAGQHDHPSPFEIHPGPLEIPDVAPQPLTISVVAPGYEETVFAAVELTPGETKRFELTPAEPTRFRLVAGSRPVAGAKVRHFNKTSDLASAGPFPIEGIGGWVRAESSEDGTVVLDTLQKVNHGYEDLGDAVYFFYIEAEGFAGRFLGPVKADMDLGDVELSRPLEVRGEVHGTPEELKNFAAEWDQPFELKTANPIATWSYAVSERLNTERDGEKLTFHLTGLRPGKLRFISNFDPPPHPVAHTYARRDPQGTDVVVEIELTRSLDDLVITSAGREKTGKEE